MRVLAWAIVVVGVTTALLVWGCFRLVRDAERMERNPELLRRRFLRLGLFYIAVAVPAILQVATGREPPITLIGLPIAAALAWLLIKHASNVKIPPT